MKAKRIISCLLTSAMAAGTWVIPVSAAEPKSSVTAMDKVYYEAEDLNTNDYHTFTSSNATVRGKLVGKNSIRITDSEFLPENTLAFSFEAAVDGLYTFESFMVDALNKQKGEYELYVNDVKYEMKAADGKSADEHTAAGQSFAAITASDVALHEGTNKLKLVETKGSSNDDNVWSMYIDYIQFTNQAVYDVTTDKVTFAEDKSNMPSPAGGVWIYVDQNTLEDKSQDPYCTLKINVPETGNYYLMANSGDFGLDAFKNGYKVTIDGKTYQFNSATTEDSDSGYASVTAMLKYWHKYFVTPIRLEAGETEIRIDVPEFYNGSNVFGLRAIALSATDDEPNDDPPPTNAPTASPEATAEPGVTSSPQVTEEPVPTATPVPTPVATLEPGVIKIEGENMPGVKVFDSFKSASGGLVGGFGVDYVQDENTKSPITISFDFEAPRACDYSFEFVTSHANNSNFATSPYDVYVNGTKCDYDMPEPGNVAMSTQTIIVPLNAGKNTVKFETTGKATFGEEQEDKQYYRFFIDYVKFTPTESATVRQEGEDIPGVESKGNYTSASGGHTGGFGADYQQNEHTANPFTITMKYNAPAEGYYRLDMRVGHANNPTVSPYDISINGNKISYMKPAADGMALCTLVVTEKLNKGENTIAFTTTGTATVNDAQYYRFFIDYIDFTRSAPERSIVIEAENPDSATYTSDMLPIESLTEQIAEFNTNTTSMLSDTQENRDKYADAQFNPASGGKYLRVQAADSALPVLVNYKFNVDIAGEYEIFVTKGDDDNVNLTQGGILVGGEQLQINADNASSVEQVGYLGDGIKLPVKKFRMKESVHLDAGENTLTVLIDAIAAGRTANTLMYTLDRIDLVKKIDAQNITMYTENHAVKKGEDMQLLFKDGLGMPFTSENVESVTYNVSNGNIAEVSEAGVVTGVNLGECDITAEINDNGQSYTVTASIIVCDESGLVIDSAKKTDGGVEVVFAATERGARFDIIAAKSGKTGDVKNALADINIQGAETIGYIYQTAVIPISAAEENEIYEVFVWDNEDDINPLYNKITVK